MRPLLLVALLVSGLARAQEPLAGDTKGVYGTDDRTDESRAAECVGETCEGSISEALRSVGRATVALVKRNKLRYDADTNSWLPSGSATLGQATGLCSACPRSKPLCSLASGRLAFMTGSSCVRGEQARMRSPGKRRAFSTSRCQAAAPGRSCSGTPTAALVRGPPLSFSPANSSYKTQKPSPRGSAGLVASAGHCFDEDEELNGCQTDTGALHALPPRTAPCRFSGDGECDDGLDTGVPSLSLSLSLSLSVCLTPCACAAVRDVPGRH